MNQKNINSYDLSRNFWNFAFDNPEKISPNHAAIYFFAIEHCNRLGWKTKFGFPSQMTMDAIGIKKHSTYIRYFNDLVEWKFFDLIQKSANQYSSNIICLVSALPKNGEALDKAIVKHGAKHTAKQKECKQTSKQLNKETIKQREEKFKISLSPYLEKYGKNILNNFYSYWTEHGDSDLKMRFEKEKSFGLSRRLSTWNKRETEFNGNKTEKTLQAIK